MHIFHFQGAYDSSVFKQYTGNYADCPDLEKAVMNEVSSLKELLQQAKLRTAEYCISEMIGNKLSFKDALFEVLCWDTSAEVTKETMETANSVVHKLV